MSKVFRFRLNYTVLDQDGQKRRFGSTVMAAPETIRNIVKTRQLGETGYEEFAPSRTAPNERSLADMIEADGCTIEATHMACFVGFLALKSGAATVDEILGDRGLVHEIVHCLVGDHDEPLLASQAEMVRMARRIERAIPGHPCGQATFRP